MCSYLNYNSELLKLGYSDEPIIGDPEYDRALVTYNGKPFIVPFPENTRIGEITLKVTCIKVSDNKFISVCNSINIDLSYGMNCFFEGLHFHDDKFYIKTNTLFK